jgi:RNA polymerase sigma factor for flagellar operon FliA
LRLGQSSLRTKARRLAEITDQLTNKLGRQPSVAELAEAMGATADELDALNAEMHFALVLKLDALSVEGSDVVSLVAVATSPDDDVLHNEELAHLVAAVDHLPQRLRWVVLGYFFHELSMHDLAEELGCPTLGFHRCALKPSCSCVT